MLDKGPVDAVHIAAPVTQSRSTGNLSLEFAASHDESHATALSPGVLAEMLAAVPLVILDVPRSASEAETVAQLLLRNAFASQMFEIGGLANVLAIGFAQHWEQRPIYDALAQGLRDRRPPAELASMLRYLERYRPAVAALRLTEFYATAGLALFSRDPFLTELPRA